MTLLYKGPNETLVRDVIAVAGTGFAPATKPEVSFPSVEFTTDVERAVESCFDQEHEPLIRVTKLGRQRLGAAPGDFEDGILWQDLRAKMVASEIWTTQWYEWSREQGETVGVLEDISDSWNLIANRICQAAGSMDRDDAESIGEDIAAILLYAAQGRAFRGGESTFFEALLGYCQAGFWPCGFVGEWPDNGRYLLWHGL